jgi:hypothetical protein
MCAAIVATLRRHLPRRSDIMSSPGCAESTSIARRTTVALAVAAVSFIAGALVHSATASREVSAEFARPAEATQSAIQNAPAAIVNRGPASAAEWDQIAEPRECDLANGILTACLFMD